MIGKIFVVATPLGNLSDITLRAIETLKSADIIACEDTRVSARLLSHYGIEKKTVSYHQHSRPGKDDFLIRELSAGKNIALITDAGTPGISDPGGKLLAAIIERFGEDAQIIPIPGPAAFVAALSISGLPTDRFHFFGFLPHKKGREKVLAQIKDCEEVAVFYESTHRIKKTLSRLAEILESNRPLVICRELTKKFETIYRGNPKEVLNRIEQGETRGEFVVVVGGKKDK